VVDLVKAGVKGKALRSLGCSLGCTLDGAWELGRDEYLKELLHIAQDWDFVTEKALGLIWQNIRDGAWSKAYYAAMWEERLEVADTKVGRGRRVGRGRGELRRVVRR